MTGPKRPKREVNAATRRTTIVVGAATPGSSGNRTMFTEKNLDIPRGPNSERIDPARTDPPFNRNGTRHRQPGERPPAATTCRSAPGQRAGAATAGPSRTRRRTPTGGFDACRRLLISSACLALVVPATAELSQTPRSRDSPFQGLYPIDDVTTSNDEYSIFLYWSPEHYRIDYPDGRGPFERDPADPDEPYTALSVFCRADGRRRGFSGPQALRARLSLPMHPAAPSVYSVLHPMYWLLGLTGLDLERVPVVVHLPDTAPFEAEMVRRRAAYDWPRPDIDINLPGTAVLNRFIADSPMEAAVTGDDVDIKLWFDGANDLVGPARLMSAHCAHTAPRG